MNADVRLSYKKLNTIYLGLGKFVVLVPLCLTLINLKYEKMIINTIEIKPWNFW